MAARTIARLFDDHSTAEAAVLDLENSGFSDADISLVRRHATTTGGTTTETDTSGAGVGATIGTVVGGGAGLLAGLGLMAIPGVGPVVAAGWLVAALAGLDDPATRAAVTAERAVLSTLEAGCSAPLGALAEVVEGEDGVELWLRAVALSEDGGLSVRMSATGPVTEADQLGRRLASDMLDDGAADLMHAPPVRNQHA